MPLVILFHFSCTQHLSDINRSIITSLRLCCWITTSVVLFSVRCVLEIWCGWVRVVSVLQASACNTDIIQQHSRRLLMMDILMSETCWVHKQWNKITSDIKLVLLFFNYYNDARSNKHKILLHTLRHIVCYMKPLALS